MKRIKIIKVHSHEKYSDYDNTETTYVFSEGIDWHEVSDEKLKELRKVINFANQNRYVLKADFYLALVEEVAPETLESHLEKAMSLFKDMEEKQKKQKEKDEKAAAARAEKRKATELDKKRKQLEKLKNELGQE